MEEIDMEQCPGYVGEACVDGTCPMIDRDEEGGYVRSIIESCEECYLYKGCADCIFEESPLCKFEGSPFCKGER